MVFIENFNKSINGLIFSLKMKLSDLNEDNNYSMFFLNEDNEIISETSDVELSTEYQSVSFELNPKASQYQTVNLAIKKKSDKDKELRFLYKMKLDISFEMDFDF